MKVGYSQQLACGCEWDRSIQITFLVMMLARVLDRDLNEGRSACTSGAARLGNAKAEETDKGLRRDVRHRRQQCSEEGRSMVSPGRIDGP